MGQNQGSGGHGYKGTHPLNSIGSLYHLEEWGLLILCHNPLSYALIMLSIYVLSEKMFNHTVRDTELGIYSGNQHIFYFFLVSF